MQYTFVAVFFGICFLFIESFVETDFITENNTTAGLDTSPGGGGGVGFNQTTNLLPTDSDSFVSTTTNVSLEFANETGNDANRTVKTLNFTKTDVTAEDNTTAGLDVSLGGAAAAFNRTTHRLPTDSGRTTTNVSPQTSLKPKLKLNDVNETGDDATRTENSSTVLVSEDSIHLNLTTTTRPDLILSKHGHGRRLGLTKDLKNNSSAIYNRDKKTVACLFMIMILNITFFS